MCDISNESFIMEEKIPKEKLIRKVLRTLPKRFSYKVTAIREAKDLRTMKLEELIGSLRTFEIELKEDKKLRKKLVAFQVELEQAGGEEGDDLT